MTKSIDKTGLYVAFRKAKNIENIMRAYEQHDLTQLRIEIDKAMDEFPYTFNSRLSVEQLLEHNSRVEEFEEMCFYDNLVIAQILEEANNQNKNVVETRSIGTKTSDI